MAKHFIVMGVSGCGKSTIGQMLADTQGVPFYDGDDYHPQVNVDKMASGMPLNDDDRKPWLEKLASVIGETSEGSVTACSALKKDYRNTLSTAGDVTFVYLHGSKETLLERLTERSNSTDHFMPSSLLDSQFSTLEDPTGESNTITVSIKDSPEQIISNIISKL